MLRWIPEENRKTIKGVQPVDQTGSTCHTPQRSDGLHVDAALGPPQYKVAGPGETRRTRAEHIGEADPALAARVGGRRERRGTAGHSGEEARKEKGGGKAK